MGSGAQGQGGEESGEVRGVRMLVRAVWLVRGWSRGLRLVVVEHWQIDGVVGDGELG